MAKEKEQRQLMNQFSGVNAMIDLDKMIDNLAREQDFEFMTMDRETLTQSAVSTGVLCFDLMMGGGYAPGRFTYFYGASGTCKSTTLFQSLRETLQQKIQAMIFDHEGSVDPKYLENLGVRLEDVCGYRNKRGEWEKTRQLYYASPNTGDDTFQFMHQILDSLPDKIKMTTDSGDSHYFLINPDYDIKQHTWSNITKGLKDKVKDRPAIVEVEDFCPQFVFMVDSLRAMISKALDEAQDKGKDKNKDVMADLARSLSKYFRLIKGRLHAKHCILVATNHITINPMAKFGNPEVEPGGNAVQFYPDCKIRLHVNRAESKVLEETHSSGDGMDRYLIGTASIKKNKAGSSFRKMDFRLWLDERGDPGRGIDPVWDMYTFLESTGMLIQSEGKKSDDDDSVKTPKGGFTVNVPGVFENRSLDWKEFKQVVLDDYETGAANLRTTCKKMLMEGEAQKRYYDFVKNNPTAKKKKSASTAVRVESDGDDLGEFTEESITL